MAPPKRKFSGQPDLNQPPPDAPPPNIQDLADEAAASSPEQCTSTVPPKKRAGPVVSVSEPPLLRNVGGSSTSAARRAPSEPEFRHNEPSLEQCGTRIPGVQRKGRFLIFDSEPPPSSDVIGSSTSAPWLAPSEQAFHSRPASLEQRNEIMDTAGVAPQPQAASTGALGSAFQQVCPPTPGFPSPSLPTEQQQQQLCPPAPVFPIPPQPPQQQQQQVWPPAQGFQFPPQPPQQQQQQISPPAQWFEFSPQPQQQQQQLWPPAQGFQFSPPPQQQKLLIFRADGSPAEYKTKFEELHPESQKLMLEIQEQINKHRYESEQIDQCSRLNDSLVYSDNFQHESRLMIQELERLSISVLKEERLAERLLNNMKKKMKATDFACRSYIELTSTFHAANVANTSEAGPSALTTRSTSAHAANKQSTTESSSPLTNFYHWLPTRPSPFMLETVAGFEKCLTECCRWIKDLEELLILDSDRPSSSSDGLSLQSVPKVMSNAYDYFIYVAAKLEDLHQKIESMRELHLANQHRLGDRSNPFLEADRQETTREEANRRRNG